MSDLFSKVGIDLGVVVLLLIVLIIVMMIMTVSMSLRLSRLNQKYRSFMKGKDAQSLEKLFHQRFKEIDKLNKQNELTKKNLADLKKIQGMTLNKYGIVKYDAFDDVGGKMSFALAMLDKENTGFILNAINSRDNCFLYLKEIVKGVSYIMLFFCGPLLHQIDRIHRNCLAQRVDFLGAQHERTLEKMHILLYDGTGTRQTRINAGKTAVVPGWKEQKESRQNEGIRSTRRKLC